MTELPKVTAQTVSLDETLAALDRIVTRIEAMTTDEGNHHD